MLYNIKFEEILAYPEKVSQWIVDELDAVYLYNTTIMKDYPRKDLEEIMKRIKLFGSKSPEELCRMVLSENYEILRDYVISDFKPFLDIVIEIKPDFFGDIGSGFSLMDIEYECRKGSLLEKLPKYVEKVINKEHLEIMEDYHWRYLLRLDITILPFAVKNGYSLSDVEVNDLISHWIEYSEEHQIRLDPKEFELMRNNFRDYAAARFISKYPAYRNFILTICGIDVNSVEFETIKEITSYKTADGKITTDKEKAIKRNNIINSKRLREAKLLKTLPFEEQEIIKKYKQMLSEA